MNTTDQHGHCLRNSLSDGFFLLYQSISTLLSLSVFILASALSPPASAHRGGSDDTDPCRIQVGSGWIHFAAYTPNISGNKSYCKSIPDLGVTNLVFDYEDKKLRQVSIEFEVTKEPEGSRVFYRSPDKSKSGTVDGVVDFNQFGPGNYQAHITIFDKDKKHDTHIPFSVGIEGDESYNGIKKALLTFFVCAVILYLSFKFSRGKEDSAIQ